MASPKRVGCIVLSLVAGIPVAFVVALFVVSAPRPTPIAAAVAEPAFAQECAVAERLGLALATRSPAPVQLVRSPQPIEVSLAPGECVAIIAAASGFQKLDSVGIYEAGGGADPVALSTHSLSGELVGHAQWCADAQAAVQLRIDLRQLDMFGRDDALQGSLLTAVYRGSGSSFGGLRGLTRGVLSERAYRRVSATTLLAELERNTPPGARAFPLELAIAPDAARLIPESSATYRLLYDAAQNGTSTAVSPSVTPLPIDAPAAWRPGAAPGALTQRTTLRAQITSQSDLGPQFPLLVSGGVIHRTLAVINPAYFGTACVELRFVRMLYGHRAEVSRVTADRATATRLPQTENEARDRLCAAQGSVMYVVPPEDHETYRLRMYGSP